MNALINNLKFVMHSANVFSLVGLLIIIGDPILVALSVYPAVPLSQLVILCTGFFVLVSPSLTRLLQLMISNKFTNLPFAKHYYLRLGYIVIIPLFLVILVSMLAAGISIGIGIMAILFTFLLSITCIFTPSRLVVIYFFIPLIIFNRWGKGHLTELYSDNQLSIFMAYLAAALLVINIILIKRFIQNNLANTQESLNLPCFPEYKGNSDSDSSRGIAEWIADRIFHIEKTRVSINISDSRLAQVLGSFFYESLVSVSLTEVVIKPIATTVLLFIIFALAAPNDEGTYIIMEFGVLGFFSLLQLPALSNNDNSKIIVGLPGIFDKNNAWISCDKIQLISCVISSTIPLIIALSIGLYFRMPLYFYPAALFILGTSIMYACSINLLSQAYPYIRPFRKLLIMLILFISVPCFELSNGHSHHAMGAFQLSVLIFIAMVVVNYMIVKLVSRKAHPWLLN